MSRTTWEIAFAVALGVTSFVGSLVVAAVVVVRLPPDYFTTGPRPLPLPHAALWVRVGVRVAQNLLGVVLVLLGVLLSLPGVPGQGFLTILLGLMLVDLPGKRRLELALVRRPSVHGAMNKLRARRGKPPLELPPAAGEAARMPGAPPDSPDGSATRG